MILGTYANLGAIDEHQSGVDIPIDRLPDIHVTHSTDDIRISPSKMKQLKYKADMAPNPPIDTAHEANTKIKGSKRKTIKSKEPSPKPLPPQPIQAVETAREINLVDNIEPEKQAKQLVNAKSDGLNNSSLNAKSNLNVKATDEKKSIVASHGSEPTNAPPKIPSDSLINRDAIQKEDREIAFNAKEQRLSDAERTLEILDAVKNQLNIQNEENQKMVLQKINEISEKVDRIAQKDDQRDTLKLDMTTKSIVLNKQENDLNDDQMKVSLPAVAALPIAKLLVERKVSSVSDQVNEPKIVEIQPTESIAADPKRSDNGAKEQKTIADSLNDLPPHGVEETNANVGRDLLSHQTAQTNGIAMDQRDKTEN